MTARGIATIPCDQCERQISVYPPEDGTGPFMCGRCAGTATAVPRAAHERPRSALQLAEQGLRRPRRAPNPPRLADQDRPDPDELARQRAQLARSTRPNKFIRR